MGKALGCTFGRDVFVGTLGASDHLLTALLERVVRWLKLLQVHRHRFVLSDLLTDLLHLHGDGGRLAETLGDALQGLQHGIDLVMELRGHTKTTRHNKSAIGMFDCNLYSKCIVLTSNMSLQFKVCLL